MLFCFSFLDLLNVDYRDLRRKIVEEESVKTNQYKKNRQNKNELSIDEKKVKCFFV